MKLEPVLIEDDGLRLLMKGSTSQGTRFIIQENTSLISRVIAYKRNSMLIHERNKIAFS